MTCDLMAVSGKAAQYRSKVVLRHEGRRDEEGHSEIVLLEVVTALSEVLTK